MTAQTIVLPYRRATPIHIPRRDLVLATSDSLSLRVSLVESDDPSAEAVYLTGGIGGPALTMLIYREAPTILSDYGVHCEPAGVRLLSVSGVLSEAPGSFDIVIPPGGLAGCPRRCGWEMRLDWGDGTQSEVLARGIMQLAPSAVTQMAPVPLLTDGSEPVLDDDPATGFLEA